MESNRFAFQFLQKLIIGESVPYSYATLSNVIQPSISSSWLKLEYLSPNWMYSLSVYRKEHRIVFGCSSPVIPFRSKLYCVSPCHFADFLRIAPNSFFRFLRVLIPGRDTTDSHSREEANTTVAEHWNEIIAIRGRRYRLAENRLEFR